MWPVTRHRQPPNGRSRTDEHTRPNGRAQPPGQHGEAASEALGPASRPQAVQYTIRAQENMKQLTRDNERARPSSVFTDPCIDMSSNYPPRQISAVEIS